MFSSRRILLLIFPTLPLLSLLLFLASNVSNPYKHPITRRALTRRPDGPPVLAYWLLGSRGETKRILNLLKAVYHPRNRYLLQLDSSSLEHERVELAISIAEYGNVDVVGKSYGVNRAGPSGLGAMLHAAAILLRVSEDWDWFVPLTSSDYPLFTQDDILYAFTAIPKDVNFMGFTNDTRQNVSQIVVDPSLYLEKTAPMFYAVETREKPDAFRIFGGSSSMILSRGFLEYCVKGWDNFPRKLLMYYSNVEFPLGSYFQTIICNMPEFENTTIVDNNLMYNINGNESRNGSFEEIPAIFAGPFEEGGQELKEIDEQLGKCCKKTGLLNETVVSSNDTTSESSCDVNCLEPGDRGIALHIFLSGMAREKRSVINVCRSHGLKKETNI